MTIPQSSNEKEKKKTAAAPPPPPSIDITYNLYIYTSIPLGLYIDFESAVNWEYIYKCKPKSIEIIKKSCHPHLKRKKQHLLIF